MKGLLVLKNLIFISYLWQHITRTYTQTIARSVSNKRLSQASRNIGLHDIEVTIQQITIIDKIEFLDLLNAGKFNILADI